MTATVSETRIGAFDAISLENRAVRVVVVPELGARVWALEDRTRSRQWIWHRGDVELARHPVGSNYDNVWAGGWEELFPNDAACRFEGRALPDHGEWWATPWRVVDWAEGAVGRVRLSATMGVIRAACDKEFLLDGEDGSLTVRYRIRSLEAEAFHFLFKQHLPLQLTDGCRLALPGGRVMPVDPAFGTIVRGAGESVWPVGEGGDGHGDLRTVLPASSAAREFVYVRDLPAGWCGADDLERGASIRMTFDRAAMPYVWLFLTYGGWRNLHTAVLEPCTNLPKDLAEAAGRSQAARLEPGGVFATSVSIRLCKT